MLLFFYLLFIPLIVCVDQYSVWNTHSRSAGEFCTHVSFTDTDAFRSWFNDICDTAEQHAWLLDVHRITNLYIMRPPFKADCIQQTLDIIVQTYFDSDHLEDDLRLFAQELKTGVWEDFTIHLQKEAFGEPFIPLDPEFGHFLIQYQCRQLPNGNDDRSGL